MPIDSNIKCHKCGYNLRGLDEAGVCPECGGHFDPAAADEVATSLWIGWIPIIFGGFVAGVIISVINHLNDYDWRWPKNQETWLRMFDDVIRHALVVPIRLSFMGFVITAQR